MESRKTTPRGTRARASGAGASADDTPVNLGGGPSASSSAAAPDEGRDAGGSLVGKVKERATAQLSTQKDRATDGLGSIAQAVRQTGQRLRDERQEGMAQYVERAADQLERFSNGLREKDVGELLHDAQRLARRQPALFIGGSFAAGLLAARFLKSSRERDEAREAGSEWRSPAAASDASGDFGARGAY
jgi:hypothetical protein